MVCFARIAGQRELGFLLFQSITFGEVAAAPMAESSSALALLIGLPQRSQPKFRIQIDCRSRFFIAQDVRLSFLAPRTVPDQIPDQPLPHQLANAA